MGIYSRLWEQCIEYSRARIEKKLRQPAALPQEHSEKDIARAALADWLWRVCERERLVSYTAARLGKVNDALIDEDGLREDILRVFNLIETDRPLGEISQDREDDALKLAFVELCPAEAMIAFSKELNILTFRKLVKDIYGMVGPMLRELGVLAQSEQAAQDEQIAKEAAEAILRNAESSVTPPEARFDERSDQESDLLESGDESVGLYSSRRENKGSLAYASCFFSHRQAPHATLVQAVARELGLRGIIPWLDRDMLLPGVSLTERLKQAMQEQTAVAIFLSKEALESPWVIDELTHAIELEQTCPECKEWIIPVYLEDPLELVKSLPLLKAWLHPSGQQVARLGIRFDGRADRVAEKIAARIYERMGFKEASELAVVLDQRGAGDRVGKPTVVARELVARVPTLVFRLDMGARSLTEVVSPESWERLHTCFKWSLSNAIGTPSPPPVLHLLGNSQLSWPFSFGRIYDQTTQVRMVTHHHLGQRFELELSQFVAPLTGGNPYCHVVGDVPGLPDGEHREIALLLMKNDAGVTDVSRHLRATKGPPAVLVKTLEQYDNADELMPLFRNVTALLQRLKSEHVTRHIHLYTTLPFHALPLFAALMRHVMDKVTFMEWRQGAEEDREQYLSLPIPG